MSIYTFVVLEVSKSTYKEIHKLLKRAGYGPAIVGDGMMDLSHVGITRKKGKKKKNQIADNLSKARGKLIAEGIAKEED